MCRTGGGAQVVQGRTLMSEFGERAFPFFVVPEHIPSLDTGDGRTG